MDFKSELEMISITFLPLRWQCVFVLVYVCVCACACAFVSVVFLVCLQITFTDCYFLAKVIVFKKKKIAYFFVRSQSDLTCMCNVLWVA
jgi:hypothetical protein